MQPRREWGDRSSGGVIAEGLCANATPPGREWGVFQPCSRANEKPKPKPTVTEKLNRVIYLSGFRFNTFIETLILEVKSKSCARHQI